MQAPFNIHALLTSNMFDAISTMTPLKIIIIKQCTLKVCESAFENKMKGYTLSVKRSIDVANYFLGFEGWSSSIKEVEVVKSEKRGGVNIL